MNEDAKEILRIQDIIKLYKFCKPATSTTTTTTITENKLKNLLREDCPDCPDCPDTEEFNNYAFEVYRLFYYRKHNLMFATLKHYSLGLNTGVFKTSRYIIKYDCYVEMRQILVYRALGFGINPDNKIVTPIWYYIFDSGYSESESSDDDATTNATNATNATMHKPAVKVDISQLRTLEIQPLLPKSVSLYKWYRSVRIPLRDYDFIVASIILGIAKSIKYCHDKNLVHGDIKPDNVLIVVTGHGVDDDTVRRHSIPETYLIDFGMCGRENTDDTGTGGTRPYCAPETMNVDETDGAKSGCVGVCNKKSNANDEADYNWCKMTKAQDVWSLGLMLFTMISYSNLFYHYKDFPKNTFDSSGYVRIKELARDPEIGAHALYPVFKKTLCAPEHRASIDEIIQLISDTLCNI